MADVQCSDPVADGWGIAPKAPPGYSWTEADGWHYWISSDGHSSCYDNDQSGTNNNASCFLGSGDPCLANYSYTDAWGHLVTTNGDGSQLFADGNLITGLQWFSSASYGSEGFSGNPMSDAAQAGFEGIALAMLVIAALIAAVLVVRKGVRFVVATTR